MAYGWFGNSIPEKNLYLDEFLDFDGVLEDYSTREESNPRRRYESEVTKQSVQEEDSLHDSISPPSGLSYDEDPLLPHPEELHEGCITDLEWVSRIVEDSNFISPELISPNTFAPISNKGGFRNKSWAKKFWLPFSMEALHVATGRRGKRRPKSGPSIWMDSQLVASSFLVEAKQKHKSAPNPEPVEAVVDVGLVQRCSHCGVENTPQWRTGPLGAKTLCNACGVRYKSGRLLPEYRPAASPTFLNQVHSNSHRKVLEMRRQKGLLPRAPSRSTVGSSGSALVRFEPSPDGWADP